MSHNITIIQIQYALAVYEYKHFGRAANYCSISQPTLSMQLQKLEEEIGVILFDRSKKPVLTTIEGERIIKQFLSIMREFKKLEQITQDSENNVSGEFTLGVIPTISSYLLPYFLSSFSKQYPLVNLNIRELETNQIIKELSKDKIDAGLLATPLGEKDLIERVLFYERFFLYSQKNKLIKNNSNIKYSDIKPNDLLLLKEGHCFRNQVINLCSLGTNIKRNFRFESGNLQTLIKLVEQGEGITFIPELALKDLKENKLCEVFNLPNPVPAREISLVYSRSFYKEKIIEALEKNIINNLPSTLKTFKKSDVKVIDI